MSKGADSEIEELFAEALKLAPVERAAFLESIGDEHLRSQVQNLLSSHAQASASFLEGDGPTAGGDAPPLVGKVVGPFWIIRVLGQGGMGTVYEAEESHPRRRVALKLLRVGWLVPAMQRRLRAEADLLGQLEHPGIARIYHAGVLETSLGPEPYFAMELVDGVRVDEWVHTQNPSIQRRLELLAAICRAVHHAHERGVIHRDLKPSNILIDREGQPRILDFGVARVVGDDLRSVTLQTELGQLVGTLPYMSPEQASGNTREIDRAADVYALGVVAFQILSGRMPYELEGKALHEAVRVICQQPPPRLGSLDRALRGDVETVVEKAIDKEKTRRYPTAGEFGQDVQRCLAREPVSARPPTLWYHVERTLRLRRGAAAALLAVLIITPFIVVLTIRARRGLPLLGGPSVDVLAYRVAMERVVAEQIQRRYSAVTQATVMLNNVVPPGAPAPATRPSATAVVQASTQQTNAGQISINVASVVADAVPGLTRDQVIVVINGAPVPNRGSLINQSTTRSGTGTVISSQYEALDMKSVIGTGILKNDPVTVFSGPEQSRYPIIRLRRGSAVNVAGWDGVWAKILPPAGTYAYVARAYIDRSADGSSGTATQSVVVRAGSTLNDLKIKVATTLPANGRVQIIGSDGDYLRIRPVSGMFYYVSGGELDFIPTSQPATHP